MLSALSRFPQAWGKAARASRAGWSGSTSRLVPPLPENDSAAARSGDAPDSTFSRAEAMLLMIFLR